MSPAFPALARAQVRQLRTSLIREVANAGLGRDDVLAFWFGESDQPTPAFIRETAAKALTDGRTFYTHNLGRPDLRAALSAYLTDLHGTAIGSERLAITSSGVSALMIAAQAIVEPGDKVAVVTPVWPNVAEIPRILGAQIAPVSLEPRNGRWGLDLDRLIDTLTPDTRAVFLNSPNNPTGWTLSADDRQAILDHCRKHGIWLMADDVYERLSFSAGRSAPSFLPLADPTDRLVSTNVAQEFGFTEAEAIEINNATQGGRAFRTFLFERMIPNLKRIGLLTDRIRPKFEALGVLQFENLKHDGQIDWATLEAPLMRGGEVIAA